MLPYFPNLISAANNGKIFSRNIETVCLVGGFYKFFKKEIRSPGDHRHGLVIFLVTILVSYLRLPCISILGWYSQ